MVINILKIIEQENWHKIEYAIQSEAAFQTEVERKFFYKNFNKHKKIKESTTNIEPSPPFNSLQQPEIFLPSIF